MLWFKCFLQQAKRVYKSIFRNGFYFDPPIRERKTQWQTEQRQALPVDDHSVTTQSKRRRAVKQNQHRATTS